MTERIVVGFDASAAARRAVDHALASAKGAGAQIVLAHVLEWSPYSFLTKEEVEERHARRTEELERANAAIMAPLVAELAAAGITVETEIRYGHVADTLIAIANEHKAGSIVAGRTGGAGLAARLFGSVAGTLAQVSPVPVTIVP
ncbi:MAG: universal stress protein [Paracoccaceae bacterium]